MSRVLRVAEIGIVVYLVSHDSAALAECSSGWTCPFLECDTGSTHPFDQLIDFSLGIPADVEYAIGGTDLRFTNAPGTGMVLANASPSGSGPFVTTLDLGPIDTSRTSALWIQIHGRYAGAGIAEVRCQLLARSNPSVAWSVLIDSWGGDPVAASGASPAVNATAFVSSTTGLRVQCSADVPARPFKVVLNSLAFADHAPPTMSLPPAPLHVTAGAPVGTSVRLGADPSGGCTTRIEVYHPLAMIIPGASGPSSGSSQAWSDVTISAPLETVSRYQQVVLASDGLLAGVGRLEIDVDNPSYGVFPAPRSGRAGPLLQRALPGSSAVEVELSGFYDVATSSPAAASAWIVDERCDE